MILGYSLVDWEEYGIKTAIHTDICKNPHSLITGKSGSGKSQSFLWYAYHILQEQESILYLADFKAGKEYAPLKGCPAYSCADNAVSMIYDYYKLYTEMRQHQNPEIGHVTLVIEEWFGLLGYIESIDKKQKNDLMAKVGEILALGRGIGNGIGIFLLVQRADSSNFSAGSREQFQNLLCFGRLSREQRLMLFAGEDLDNTRNYKTGQGIALIDGQEGATEIIVPWIPEQDILLKRIRNYMDKQPSLQELLHQIQSTGGVAEHKP
jgi:hypothetical protein